MGTVKIGERAISTATISTALDELITAAKRAAKTGKEYRAFLNSEQYPTTMEYDLAKSCADAFEARSDNICSMCDALRDALEAAA